MNLCEVFFFQFNLIFFIFQFNFILFFSLTLCVFFIEVQLIHSVASITAIQQRDSVKHSLLKEFSSFMVWGFPGGAMVKNLSANMETQEIRV